MQRFRPLNTGKSSFLEDIIWNKPFYSNYSKLFLIGIFYLTSLLSLNGQTERSQGQTAADQSQWQPEQLLQLGFQAYQNGKWYDVVKYLGEAAHLFPNNDLLYLYLGTAYQILGEDGMAEETLVQGINLQSENMQKIAFVLGNYYYSVGLYDKAVDAYNLATWGGKQMLQAFLNRANLFLAHGFYANALNDYTYFLFRKPFDSQREKIQEVIDKLTGLGMKGRIQAEGGVIAANIYPGNPYPGGYNGPQARNPFAANQAVQGGQGTGNRSVDVGAGAATGGAENAVAGSPVSPADSAGPDSVGDSTDSTVAPSGGKEGLPSLQDGSQTAGEGSSNSANIPLQSPPDGSGQADEKKGDSSNAGNSLQNGLNNSSDGTYRRPVGDTGNTVGTGGNPESQVQQLNRVRYSLQQLNQNAIILNRDNPYIIKQPEKFSKIDE